MRCQPSNRKLKPACFFSLYLSLLKLPKNKMSLFLFDSAVLSTQIGYTRALFVLRRACVSPALVRRIPKSPSFVGSSFVLNLISSLFNSSPRMASFPIQAPLPQNRPIDLITTDGPFSLGMRHPHEQQFKSCCALANILQKMPLLIY